MYLQTSLALGKVRWNEGTRVRELWSMWLEVLKRVQHAKPESLNVVCGLNGLLCGKCKRIDPKQMELARSARDAPRRD